MNHDILTLWKWLISFSGIFVEVLLFNHLEYDILEILEIFFTGNKPNITLSPLLMVIFHNIHRQ